ncbi:hypothetical protein Glove_9g297 [Diversispora epigaea]|uniref:Amidohydrolase 3 domain-containing protein n=1 Tax=Diversispora epigaea TaxID=1348612 RepID=A0A397JR32_9GLOM|nr:hypothetical protein Glove_9g297 [Diversispora epigaea]
MNLNTPTSNTNTSTTTSFKQEPNGYVIYNANVYTSDNKIPRVDSFTVLNGKFVDIGSQTDLLKKWNNLQHIDLQGRAVLPGLIDAHAMSLNKLKNIFNRILIQMNGLLDLDGIKNYGNLKNFLHLNI